MRWFLLLAMVGGIPPRRPPTAEEYLEGGFRLATALAFFYMCLFLITLALLIREKWLRNRERKTDG